jgi:hypothetical protein
VLVRIKDPEFKKRLAPTQDGTAELPPRRTEMQPVLRTASVLGDPDRCDPPDVFCSLGSLIVEGRLPSEDDRGYGEGPHVPPARSVGGGRHECSQDHFLVSSVLCTSYFRAVL